MQNGVKNGIAPPIMTGQAKIMVVDDQMPVAMMMVFLLTRAACEAKAITILEKALRLAATGSLDLASIKYDGRRPKQNRAVHWKLKT